jgi:hypothetical protein
MARETGGDTAEGNKFETSRRRFLGSSGLAAIGAVIGGALPLSRNGSAFRRPTRRRLRPPRLRRPRDRNF